MSQFAELVAASNYSFLRGASPPADMVGRAIELGMVGIGIADRNSVAGVVRAHAALKDARARLLEEQGKEIDFRLAVGARLVFADDTPDIVAYPATRHGWGRLTRLLTTGNMRAVKGGCILYFADLLAHLDDLLLIVLPASTATPQAPRKNPLLYRHDDEEEGEDDEEGGAPARHLRLVPPSPPPSPQGLAATLAELRDAAPDRIWLGLSMPRQGADARRLACLRAIAEGARVPLLATNDALYATPEQRPLHDVLTCIEAGVTIAEAGRRLNANAERHLKSPAEMARLFAACPQAIAETARLLSRIAFTLNDLRYEYPHEPVPKGWLPQDWLEHIVLKAAHHRYPDGLPEKLCRLLKEEFTLIRERNYAYYFLTVHDIVQFARTREKPILCQGRGSAANSVVCFLLGITSVDPLRYDLLFSRFVSSERNEPPDIDVDFEHERREEVMQYIYKRYGRERAGIAATVIHYRPRSALREVGKALGFTEDVTARLSSTIWGSYAGGVEERRFAEPGFDPRDPRIARMKELVGQILSFPRHLSQHVGGFVLTQDRLDETVPIHNGAMEGRSFIEWDKDDIDELGLMKVDVLALGMLTCIRKSFELMEAHGLGRWDLDTIPPDDPPVYEMLCRGDSIGVFQVESRAQINMLPRLRPKEFYDLVIQVAIVRPGPIQGDMVHPYLRRRSGKEKVEYPAPAPEHGPPDELRQLLGRTEGVPLFQEQAMKLAITAARFTPEEANRLRRSMATFRRVGGMEDFEQKMVGGMVARGYDAEFALRCFRQIEGFGSYGFPESHALAFARLVYVSSWIKCHHPAVFACALLNSQPMGFYAPAQLVRDAREHGVEVRPADVGASGWDNGLEPVADGGPALRLGFRQIGGFRKHWVEQIAAARGGGPFRDIEDFARRAGLPQRALRLLADADAFGSLGDSRRAALWTVRRTPEGELPLFAAARARELGQEADMALPEMSAAEQVIADYQLTRLSLKGHPMRFLRDRLTARGIASCADTADAKAGARISAAGVVLVRQRPGKGKAIFVTIEDETGIANIVIWARLFETCRRQVMSARLMLVEGEIQRSPEGVVHLMASRIHDLTGMLDRLDEDTQPGEQAPRALPGGAHPRNVRILPRSRDFH